MYMNIFESLSVNTSCPLVVACASCLPKYPERGTGDQVTPHDSPPLGCRWSTGFARGRLRVEDARRACVAGCTRTHSSGSSSDSVSRHAHALDRVVPWRECSSRDGVVEPVATGRDPREWRERCEREIELTSLHSMPPTAPVLLNLPTSPCPISPLPARMCTYVSSPVIVMRRSHR
jgi:hypothetical protein